MSAGRLVRNVFVHPTWLDDATFWYRRGTPTGHTFVRVAAATGKVEPAFDHAALARSLSETSGTAVDADRLPIGDIHMTQGTVRFAAFDRRWSFSVATQRCVAMPGSRPDPCELISPDRTRSVFLRGHDIWVRHLASGDEAPLTTDGEIDFSYGRGPDPTYSGGVAVRDGAPMLPALGRPMAVWSADSRRVVTHRLDQRRVRDIPLIQSTPPAGGRPVLHLFKYPLPGDEHVFEYRLHAFDVDRRRAIWVSDEVEPNHHPPILRGRVWWDGPRVFFVQADRGERRLRLRFGDIAAGTTRTVLEERAETYLDTGAFSLYTDPCIRTFNDGREAVWYSQRDGWGHLYLYDLDTGRLVRQITQGRWAVRTIEHLDPGQRVVLFTAGGREPGRNPYLRHLYRVDLGGGEPQLLTPEDADHSVSVSPAGTYFASTFSRVDTVPHSIVRAVDGRSAHQFEEADVAALLEGGYHFPEPFVTKGRDGETDIHGVMFFPSDFDPTKRYPVVEDCYPGPFVNRSPTVFSPGRMPNFPRPAISPVGFGNAPAMAELGFIVLTIDGMGSAFRSKSFQDVALGNLGDAGLPDHMAAVQELARTRPYMDIGRVGIYGHSGGGFQAARAILAHPEFYKVAVASAGNHDQRGFCAYWGERYLGMPRDADYETSSNASLAHQLTGKLLIIAGELDENVQPAVALQLADALIRANKDFDLLYVPGGNHTFTGREDYVIRREWDYFVTHLLGARPPKEYRIRPENTGRAETTAR